MASTWSTSLMGRAAIFCAPMSRRWDKPSPCLCVPGSALVARSPRLTFVVIASQRPLDLAALRSVDAGDGDAMLAEMLLDRAATAALLAEGRQITLSDRYTPVDQMLAPVFRGKEIRPDSPQNN